MREKGQGLSANAVAVLGKDTASQKLVAGQVQKSRTELARER